MSIQQPPEPAVQELLAGYPVVVTQQVAWGDMDSFGHVNNVVYFRYFENARLEYFRRLDWFNYQAESGVGPIISKTEARYRRALAYPDVIHIGARLLDMEADRFTLEHRLVSEKLRDIAALGQVTVVAYRYAERTKTPLPDELKRRIAELESATN
jgi:acyl-CoA thioester hydrolase